MEKLLTPAEVTAITGISVDALAQLRYTGKGPAYRRLTARAIRYTETDVREWIDASRRTSTLQEVS